MKKEHAGVENCINALKCSPLMLTFMLFPSTRKAQNGHIPIPKPGEKGLGFHSVCVNGYSREKRYFIFLNSWGREWGDNGSGYLPFEYFELNLIGEVMVMTINVKKDNNEKEESN